MTASPTETSPSHSSLPSAAPDDGGAPEHALARAEWTAVLFAELPKRAELAALRPTWPRETARVRVHRNLACEFLTSVAAPYLAFAGLEVEWLMGDYDDSLSLADAGDADAEVVWLDHARFSGDDGAALGEWLVGRLRVLRGRTRAPILVNGTTRETERLVALAEALERASAEMPGVFVCDPAPVAQALEGRFWDARNAKLSGLPYSNAASVLLGRQLGSRWLPAALRPGLKAVVVDLDHTLYAGVLGEDGVQGVRLEEGHAALQRELLALRERGLFLAVCSKNEDDDVQAMFAERADFPLRLEHLSARAVSWEGKAAGIRRIAAQLRIAPDAMLYVDDNPGELAAIAAELPELRMLHAGPDVAVTLRALRDYPGLHRWREDDADRLRVADLAAAAEREASAQSAGSATDYLRSLQVRVGFRVDARRDLERLHALSTKTNQFNLALRRASLTDVADYLERPDAHAVTVSLRDRLSDSGVIGSVLARREDGVLRVQEVCVSCRALGRELEDLLVLGALRAAAGDTPPEAVVFEHATGPRNGPARRWLERLDGAPLAADQGEVRLAWPECLARIHAVETLLDDDAVTRDSE